MEEFWNKRYADNETVYGFEPNAYFKLFIDTHQPGRILLPAEGEGRNALYAAKKGWQVDAFDFSEVAKEKALDLAGKQNLQINYELKDIKKYKASVLYDAVALIYVHLPEGLRKTFHAEVVQSIIPGGYLVFESFAKEQSNFDSGGPKDPALLYDISELRNDFERLRILNFEQKEVVLEEGPYHKGKASVIRLVAPKV